MWNVKFDLSVEEVDGVADNQYANILKYKLLEYKLLFLKMWYKAIINS